MSQSKVYRYNSGKPLYAHAWSLREDKPHRFAVCSCSDDGKNSIELCRMRRDQQIAQLDVSVLQFPVTKIQFLPSLNAHNPDMFITSSDCLRMYGIKQESNHDKIKQIEALKSDSRQLSPVLSFDWSQQRLELLVAATNDTLINIWDLNKKAIDVRFCGHERPVTDVCFSPFDANLFVTCGSDGCLRLFDRRNLEYSYQVYGTSNPLLRCQYNRIDSNYIGVIEHESKDLAIIDLRNPSQPIMLKRHEKYINGFQWCPGQSNIVLTCAEDGNCYIWDVNKDRVGKPTMGYNCNEPVANCAWSCADKEWCSIVHGTMFEALKV